MRRFGESVNVARAAVEGGNADKAALCHATGEFIFQASAPPGPLIPTYVIDAVGLTDGDPG